jgi:IS66 C-terminal element
MQTHHRFCRLVRVGLMAELAVSARPPCKLCAVEPHAYLEDVITKIVNRHPNSQIDDLLPWAYLAQPALKAVA